MTTVAIHQPNFFPWLGYFDKLYRADIFVFLDDVQQQKTGGTWTNRVRMMVGGVGRWVTAPLERSYTGMRKIVDLRFDDSSDWRGKVLRTLEVNYRRAPAFSEAIKLVEPLITLEERSVARYNMNAIRVLSQAIGLDAAKCISSSNVPHTGTGTERLVSLVQSLGADTYLCGGGAASYQDDGAFERAGIRLVYQDFAHPTYFQFGASEFVSGLSVIDALMNCGVRGTAKLVCR